MQQFMFRPQPPRKPLVSSLTPPSGFVSVGQWVELTAIIPPLTEEEQKTFGSVDLVWTVLSRPAQSEVNEVETLDEERLRVAFIPDAVGDFVVQLRVMWGDTRVETHVSRFTARVLALPHGVGSQPNMRWLSRFVRDWVQLVEDKETAYSLWSSYAQVVSRLLLQLYEINLGKSIETIPRLLQHRWVSLPLRLDLGVSLRVRGYTAHNGEEGLVNGDSAFIEGAGTTEINRVLVIDGEAVRSTSKGVLRTEYDIDAQPIAGCALQMDRSLGAARRHCLWSMPSGVLEAQTNDTALWDLGGRAGDLLEVEWAHGQRRKVMRCRVAGVTREGWVGFHWSDLPLSDTRSTQEEKKAAVAQVAAVLAGLQYEPDTTLTEDAERIYAACTRGDWTYLEQRGLALRPRHLYRLSTYRLVEDTVSVPYLQTALNDPPFILRENEDYGLYEVETRGGRDKGMFLRLATNVVFDERRLPAQLWADTTFVHNWRAIEDNFGKAVGAEYNRLPKAARTFEQYKTVVYGLMYAVMHGPTPHNLRLAAHALLGLPISGHNGIVRLLRHASPTKRGIVVVEDVTEGQQTTGRNRVYYLPRYSTVDDNPQTGRPWSEGDTLPAYTILCKGVVVSDWVSDPAWWTPLYDGGVELPQPHTAFVGGEWFPKEGVFWPPEALQPMEEMQKVHAFMVSMDVRLFDGQDAHVVVNFIRGVYETWRRGQSKKGLRPHYTMPVFIVRLQHIDEIGVGERAMLSVTPYAMDDITGYEAVLSTDTTNSSGETLLYSHAPLYASRTPYQRRGYFAPPSDGATEYAGCVMLVVDQHAGSFLVGDTVTQPDTGASGEIVGIEAAHSSEPPVTHYLFVRPLPPAPQFSPYHTIDNGSTDEASVLAVCPARLKDSAGHLWCRLSGLPYSSYRSIRFRDQVVVRDTNNTRRTWRVWRIDTHDPSSFWVSPLFSSDPTACPPLPFGTGQPNGNSTDYPLTEQDLAAWQESGEEVVYQVLRPVCNPLFSSELYLTPPQAHGLLLTLSGAGIHQMPPVEVMHRDLFRSGAILRLIDPTHSSHGDEFEIQRTPQMTGSSELEATQITGWDDPLSPLLTVSGPAITDAHAAIEFDIVDPHLPFVVHLEGETLPVQTGVPDDFTVELPSTAHPLDDFYVGCWFQALDGAGAYEAGVVEGWWPVRAYDATTKQITLGRSHRGIFDDTTVFRLVSLRREDCAPDAGMLHDTFPASLRSFTHYAAVKAGAEVGAGPTYCTATMTSGSSTVTINDVAEILPNGKDLLTANGGGDTPFDVGVVQAGDILRLHAAAPADEPACAIAYTVLTVPTSNTLTVSPTPTHSTAGGVYFTIHRPNPTKYVWDGSSYVVGDSVHKTNVSRWRVG